jgi:mannose-1-phosphate guanylyltransferase
MKNNYVVIMAGGIGTRFWPFSRTNHPKQFLDILGNGKTLIQMTVERFRHICPAENIFVVTNSDYYFHVKTQLPDLADSQILLEPLMRNTAACIAYACYKIRKRTENANIVIAPADHVILKQDAFSEAISKAIWSITQNSILLTLGITPTRPDTGYGYIQSEEEDSDGTIQKVKTFTEKPNLPLAIEFLESGDYLWNAGIFVWNVKAIIEAFEKYMPEMAELFAEAQINFFTPNESKAIKQLYQQCHNISIDYAIMEKANNVYVMRCDLGWSDLGTWKSLYEFSPKNKDSNVLKGNIMTYETTNCMVRTPTERLVVLQGLDNYIVVEHNNVLLICQKDEEQRIKQILEEVNRNKGRQFS